MDRDEFEKLRDLPGKTINGDILLQSSKESSPLLSTTVSIMNNAGIEAKLRIELNEMTESKTLNVWIPGIGAICRLEVDAKPHKPYGRSHKHSLELEDCPLPHINLSRNIIDRSDLTGKSIKEVFIDFCQKANIEHLGDFKEPTQ
ncbi:MAG: hypothetical protein WBK77_04985 [Alphaproteobacteria bacterium]